MNTVIIGNGFSARFFARKLACDHDHEVKLIAESVYSPPGLLKKLSYKNIAGGASMWGGNLFFPLGHGYDKNELIRLVCQIFDMVGSGSFYVTDHGVGLLLPQKTFPKLLKVNQVSATVTKVVKTADGFVIELGSQKIRADNVIVATGASTKLEIVNNGFLLHKIKTGTLFDKFMTIEPTKLSMGVHTEIINGLHIARYVQRDNGLTCKNRDTYLKIVHLLNQQIGIKSFSPREISQFIQMAANKYFVRSDSLIALTTVALNGSEHALRLIDGRVIIDPVILKDFDISNNPMLYRALHVDYRQNDDVIDHLKLLGVANDQYKLTDPCFKFGSVGYRMLKLLNTCKIDIL